MKNHYRIQIYGLVQGVGFRPFVYRIALKHKLNGSVENRNDGVVIKIQVSESSLQRFISDLKYLAPPASMIESVEVTEIKSSEVFTTFSIIKSSSISDAITEVSPDIAVCEDCLQDMKVQTNRIDYPFINCTNCGPRFTIITDLPYDRAKTSMKPFVMCRSCKEEYMDVLDRRFHAQPVACNDCGPHYHMAYKSENIESINEILVKAVNVLENGGVMAIKGMGGYFIACNALDESACLRIRNLKNREGKPFAVMFRDVETIEKYAEVTEKEKEILLSFRRPVVLLKQKKIWPKALNSGLNRIGCMLPYMPFHYLLFERTGLPAFVMTSGNISEEPIIIDDTVAAKIFGDVTDGVLSYNRDISNRCDDSVILVINDKPRLVRRSRGYVPNPIRLNINTEGILAVGAELKNTFCVGKSNQAILSQHIGDLKNVETWDFYKETITRFSKLFRFTPKAVACDLHPDYLSSKYAAETGLPLIKIQHHHAHIASVLAESRFEGKVIGVSLDGTGLGDDNAIWGGEFLVCDLMGYERLAHLEYIHLPGGDAAASQPWRMAFSYLYASFGSAFMGFDLPFLKDIDHKKADLLIQGIEKNINCPPTSSAGRLFDAISAMNGICLQHSFEAEGPMLLEALIDNKCSEFYPFENKKDVLSFTPMIFEIVSDILKKVPVSIISARFHNTVVHAIVQTCKQIQKNTGLDTVALSGGVFQNAYILERTEIQLIKMGFRVLSNSMVPANDGGIALGQIAIAAKKISEA
jgi:hydrogenase maturation protein HypF